MVDLFIQRGHDSALTHTPLYSESNAQPSGAGPSDATVDLNVRHAQAHTLQGKVAVVAAESPLLAQRETARTVLKHFVEVHVATPKDACIDRDTLGIWKRALNGDLRNFTGVDRPYESPTTAECTVDLSTTNLENAITQCANTLETMGLLKPSDR
jgi:adenylylsulfate kinase-like enzyme